MAKPNQDPKNQKKERLAKKCFNLNSIELREYAALLPILIRTKSFFKGQRAI